MSAVTPPRVARRPPSTIERFLIAPVREVVLGIRDFSSPEMREARRQRQLAEINRVGDGWYLAKRVIATTIGVESFVTLKSVGDVLAGHLTWARFSAVSFRAYFFCGLVTLVISVAATAAEIERARKDGRVEESQPQET